MTIQLPGLNATFVRGVAFSSNSKEHSSLDSDDESVVNLSSEDIDSLHSEVDCLEHFFEE